MARIGLLGLILLGLGCEAATAPAATAPPATTSAPAPAAPVEAPVTHPARLEWSLELAPSGDALLVSYTVTSTTDRTIYLSDLMPVAGGGGLLLGEDFINVTGGEPGVARLVRGRLDSVAPVPVPLDPGARALEPGKSATGTARVKLPLAPAHYHGQAAPLNGAPTQAVLEIGYLDGEVHWSPLQLADGRGLTTSMPMDAMRWLVAGPLPIPTR